jgi:O-6-methylguanine DNA methyltransferase
VKPLDCARIESDLAAVAADEADAAARHRVNAHVKHCEDCRAVLDDYRQVESELISLRERPIHPAPVARARERLEVGLADLRRRMVRYAIFPSPLGNVLVARTEVGVVLVEYLRGRAAHWRGTFEAEGLEAIEDETELSALHRDFADYLAGRTRRLDWPLDLRLAHSDFQREVLKATAAIPYGAVVSYKRVAREIGQPKAVRAVAQALRHNPVAIAIPCHRVIGAEGALVGYSGGKTDLKEKLLSVEGVPIERARGDYRVARDSMYVLVPGDSEYCLPSCPSPETLRSGFPTLFGSRERAESAGYRPCTTCRPDLHPLVTR